MTTPVTVLPLLVFEAAGCLMAIDASEIGHIWSDPDFAKIRSGVAVDLDEYFTQGQSQGPWLRWVRGTRSAWLRVWRIIDVVPVSLAALTPLPALLSAQQRTRAFLAAGVQGDDVFLLLDPGRLMQ